MIFGKNGAKHAKAPKQPKIAGKKLFSSRTAVGVFCIILAFVITFGVAPLVNRFSDQKVDIVRLRTDVERGQIIDGDDIEVVSVGFHNLPGDVIKDTDAVIGKYAATDLYTGDYLFAGKLSTDNKSAEDVLLGLKGEKVAVSVSIGNFAEGLSGKLENGDVVSIIIYDKEADTSYVPAELKYVKVITATTSDGIDKDKAEGGVKLETVTLLVTPEQAERLAYYNSTTNIHFALVYRGDTDKADAFIKIQDDYIKFHPIDNTLAAEEGSNG